MEAKSKSILTLCFIITLSTGSGAAQTPANHKVAFIADSDHGASFQAVLDLIKSEGADAVVHAGDLAYSSSGITKWHDRIVNTLGADFPYFACVGNHDAPWGRYQAVLEPHMTANSITWDGDYGRQSSHEFMGIHYVMVDAGETSGDHAGYVRDRHAANNAMWKVSVWHENMSKMQLGRKSDKTGWGVYEESRKAGAIVSTAHAHSYQRTYELSHVENTQVSHFNDDQANPINLIPDDTGTGTDEGRIFVFVSGLGGKNIRRQRRCQDGIGPGAKGDCQIWAAAYTSDQGANLGALFAEFNINGDPTLSYWYFKSIDGNVADEFYVRSQHSGGIH